MTGTSRSRWQSLAASARIFKSSAATNHTSSAESSAASVTTSSTLTSTSTPIVNLPTIAISPSSDEPSCPSTVIASHSPQISVSDQIDNSSNPPTPPLAITWDAQKPAAAIHGLFGPVIDGRRISAESDESFMMPTQPRVRSQLRATMLTRFASIYSKRSGEDSDGSDSEDNNGAEESETASSASASDDGSQNGDLGTEEDCAVEIVQQQVGRASSLLRKAPTSSPKPRPNSIALSLTQSKLSTSVTVAPAAAETRPALYERVKETSALSPFKPRSTLKRNRSAVKRSLHKLALLLGEVEDFEEEVAALPTTLQRISGMSSAGMTMFSGTQSTSAGASPPSSPEVPAEQQDLAVVANGSPDEGATLCLPSSFSDKADGSELSTRRPLPAGVSLKPVVPDETSTDSSTTITEKSLPLISVPPSVGDIGRVDSESNQQVLSEPVMTSPFQPPPSVMCLPERYAEPDGTRDGMSTPLNLVVVFPFEEDRGRSLKVSFEETVQSSVLTGVEKRSEEVKATEQAKQVKLQLPVASEVEAPRARLRSRAMGGFFSAYQAPTKAPAPLDSHASSAGGFADLLLSPKLATSKLTSGIGGGRAPSVRPGRRSASPASSAGETVTTVSSVADPVAEDVDAGFKAKIQERRKSAFDRFFTRKGAVVVKSPDVARRRHVEVSPPPVPQLSPELKAKLGVVEAVGATEAGKEKKRFSMFGKLVKPLGGGKGRR
ncbi:hypothetical protein HDU96_004370 [Phlyctochytrium bullatum]|nr:hypothetical protein HDU96_004370 [Phlyctochytrium bullatum]